MVDIEEKHYNYSYLFINNSLLILDKTNSFESYRVCIFVLKSKYQKEDSDYIQRIILFLEKY